MATRNELTLDQMRTILGRGESVGYRGRRLSTLADLPSEADVATDGGDPVQIALTASDIDAQIAKLQGERAKLTAAEGKAAGRKGGDHKGDERQDKAK